MTVPQMILAGIGVSFVLSPVLAVWMGKSIKHGQDNDKGRRY